MGLRCLSRSSRLQTSKKGFVVVSLRSLLIVLGLSLVPSLVLADEPSLAEKAQRRVEEGLLKPLAERESETSRFSRARPMPRERRVRITQANETQDAAGRPFVSFAVDVRFGAGEWQQNDV